MGWSSMSIICWLTMITEKDSVLFCADSSSNEHETVVTHSSLRKNILSGRCTFLILYVQPVCVSLNLVSSLPNSKWSFKGDWRTSAEDWWGSLQGTYFGCYHFSMRVTSVFLLKPQLCKSVQIHSPVGLKLLVLQCIGECAFKIYLASELCLRVLVIDCK